MSSWWPTQYTWEASGMNAGYWTDENEDWYIARLHAIRNGNANIKTTKQWRSELKRGKRDLDKLLKTARSLGESWM